MIETKPRRLSNVERLWKQIQTWDDGLVTGIDAGWDSVTEDWVVTVQFERSVNSADEEWVVTEYTLAADSLYDALKGVRDWLKENVHDHGK